MPTAPPLEDRRPHARLMRLVEACANHGIPNNASAISFQLLTALVPGLLFAVGLAGFLGLQGEWREVAPELRERVSPEVFTIADDTVRQVLEQRPMFWITAGGLIALWQLSGAMRAVMHALSVVYADEDERPFLKRMWTSVWLAAAVGLLALAATAVLRLSPLVFDGVLAFLVRYLVGAALLLAAVDLVVRFAPACPQPGGLITRGTALAVAGWIAASGLFVLYLTELADYGSIFANLATIVVLLAFLYLTTLSLLVGVQVDALVRGGGRGR